MGLNKADVCLGFFYCTCYDRWWLPWESLHTCDSPSCEPSHWGRILTWRHTACSHRVTLYLFRLVLTTLETLGVVQTYAAFGKNPTKVVRNRKRLMPVTARVTLQKKEQIVSSAVTQPITGLLMTQVIPERQQDAIAGEKSQPPQECKSHIYVMEVVVAPSQQIPALKFLGWKSLGHFIIHYALHAPSAKVEDISHIKLMIWAQTAGRTPDLLLQRCWWFFGYDTCRECAEKNEWFHCLKLIQVK